MPKLREDIKNSFSDHIIGLIIISDYWIKNSLLKFFQFLLFRNKNISGAKRILIFRTGSLGDSICALPAIYSIRKNFPEAQIDILTNAGAENLVSIGSLINRSLFNEIINYFGIENKLLFKILKEKKYDLFIQLPQYYSGFIRQTRDIFISKAIGAKYAFGWQIDSTRFLAKFQERLIEFENERDRLINILLKNGLKSYGLVYPLEITSEIESKIESVLQEKRLKFKDQNIGMVVGAKSKHSLWPIKYFMEVADHLLKKGYNILLFGGPDDIERAEQITGDNVFNFCGKLTPLETAEMMKHCKLVISNDTGPMHLTYAVGTTVMAIISGRNYLGQWDPPKDEKNIVVRNYTDNCINCFKNECNNDCLIRLSPKILIEKLK